MKLNHWSNIFYAIVIANVIVQHVIQINNGILEHVNASVKIIIGAKKIVVGILANVFVKMTHLKSTAVESLIMCNRIIIHTNNIIYY